MILLALSAGSLGMIKSKALTVTGKLRLALVLAVASLLSVVIVAIVNPDYHEKSVKQLLGNEMSTEQNELTLMQKVNKLDELTNDYARKLSDLYLALGFTGKSNEILKHVGYCQTQELTLVIGYWGKRHVEYKTLKAEYDLLKLRQQYALDEIEKQFQEIETTTPATE